MPETPKTIILYSRPNCFMVRSVKRFLNEASIPFEEIDIHEHPEGRQRVREINNGNESVPTLAFPDGSTLTEPGLKTLHAKLVELGYSISEWSR